MNKDALILLALAAAAYWYWKKHRFDAWGTNEDPH